MNLLTCWRRHQKPTKWSSKAKQCVAGLKTKVVNCSLSPRLIKCSFGLGNVLKNKSEDHSFKIHNVRCEVERKGPTYSWAGGHMNNGFISTKQKVLPRQNKPRKDKRTGGQTDYEKITGETTRKIRPWNNKSNDLAVWGYRGAIKTERVNELSENRRVIIRRQVWMEPGGETMTTEDI